MKKGMAFLLGLVFLVTAGSSAHAFMRKDMDLIKGKVVAHDTKHKKLTVEGERGEGKIVIDISSADVTTSTNPGDRVVVIYKKEGIRATIVKPVPKGR